MSMLTRIVLIPAAVIGGVWREDVYASMVCDRIKSYEDAGWYLRGIPTFIECYRVLMLTFEKEKPDTDDSKSK